MEQVNDTDRVLKSAVRIMLYVLAVGIVILLLILLQSPLGAVWRRLFDALFGLSNTQVTWFITRASGLVAYLLLWLSTVWGLGVSSKFFDRVIPRAFTYDAHEYISLLAIGMTAIHVVILLWDTFMPFNVAQLFVPFISTYRPFWVGIGIIGTYLTLLVTVTFYLRKWIGIPAFRAIHWLSFLAFFGVLVHSWFAGTDTNFAVTRWMYLGTALVVVLMTFLWLATRRNTPGLKDEPGSSFPPLKAFGNERLSGRAGLTVPAGERPAGQVPFISFGTEPGSEAATLPGSFEPLALPPLSPKTEGVRWQKPNINITQ